MTGHRILFISFHFPPSAAVGGQRTVNFARALSSLGWEPHVLTIQDKDVQQIDRERLRSVDGIAVHKTGVLPTVAGIWHATKKRIRATALSSSDAGVPAGAAPSHAVRTERLPSRLRRWVLSFLLLPDWERGWVLPATLAAIRVIRRRRIDWVMTSCPPYSVHLVGLAVRRATGAKWAADFRDPWMTTGSKRLFPTSALSLGIESWLERRVVERADLLVFNVERLRNAYRERYAHVPAAKFVFIPNAVTLPPASDTAAQPKYDAFTVAYTGSLYVGRSPEPVFDALSRLIRDGRAAPDRVRVKLVGQCRSVNGVSTASLARQYGLESVVDVTDPVPHDEALNIIRRSHLALLLAPGLPFQIPAKVYDYLGVGARILALAEEGGTADLVTQTDCGRAFDPTDVEGIAGFLHAEMTTRRPINGSQSESLARFDARRITEELVGHFARVSAPAAGASPWTP